MKHIFKRNLKSLKLILLLSFFLNSCQKDETISESDNSEQIIEHVDAQLALDEIFENTSNSRSENNYAQNIDFDKKAIKFNSETYSAYTFALSNNNITARSSDYQYSTENLSITLNDDGSYTSHIFRYIPDMSWFNNPNNTIDNYSGQIQLLNPSREILNDFHLIDGEQVSNDTSNRNTAMRSDGSCTTTIIEYLVCLPNPFVEDCHYEYSLFVNCPSGGSPSEENPCGNNGTEPCGDENPNGGGSGNGGVTTNPILGTCYETNTCEESDEDIIENCIGSNDDFSSLSNRQISQIADFIDANGCSEENSAFVEFTIGALNENFHETTIEEVFEILDIEQDYKDQMSISEKNIFDNLSKKNSINTYKVHIMLH